MSLILDCEAGLNTIITFDPTCPEHFEATLEIFFAVNALDSSHWFYHALSMNRTIHFIWTVVRQASPDIISIPAFQSAFHRSRKLLETGLKQLISVLR